MSQYPLVLSHPQVRRIMDRNATSLILSRRLPLGEIDIHDSLTLQRNQRHRKSGRVDLQEDPLVMTVEIADREPMPLMELTLKMVRGAGHKTTEDFYCDWIERRRKIDVELQVYVYGFQRVSTARFLHVRVHRGYTSNAAQAARGEPEAISSDELEKLSRRQHRVDEDFLRQARRSIGLRAKEAAQRGDLVAYNALSSELALLVGSSETLTLGTAVGL